MMSKRKKPNFQMMSKPKSALILLIFSIFAIAAYQIEIENIAYYRSVIIGAFIALYRDRRNPDRFFGGLFWMLLNIAYDWRDISRQPERWWYLFLSKAFMYIGSVYGAYRGVHEIQRKIRVKRQNMWLIVTLCSVLCSAIGAVGGEFVWQLKRIVLFEKSDY
ncbi:unnamed protein product [Caenorhabditis brenneri]